MEKTIKLGLLACAIVLFISLAVPATVVGSLYANMDTLMQKLITKQVPRPPATAFAYSIFRTAPLEVAKVFGRTQGCSDADAELIESTARAAIDAGLDPSIAAATVGVESGCNQFAVSSKGAVGIMQIMPRIWKDQYDFAGDVNLFNRKDNLETGAKIEAGLISQYGMSEGVRRYNGVGIGCDSCDAGYVSKILTLAGRR